MNIPPKSADSAFSCFLLWLSCLSLFLALPGTLLAHPTPDIPVKAVFVSGGSCTLVVEITPRLFDPDPEKATPLSFVLFKTLSEDRKTEMRSNAAKLVPQHIEFFFEPLGQILPAFDFQFTGEGQKPLSDDDENVVLTGTWTTPIAAGISGWKIRAVPNRLWSVVFQNVIDGGVHPRVAVLFPGETSHTLDLTGMSGREPSEPTPGSVSRSGSVGDSARTFGDFFVKGFLHVLPLGLDHILFVLGLFLLSRQWKPLLWQVTAFTLAHSVTLALAALNMVKAPSSVVEPIIAASIVAVAVENIFHPKYSVWRLLVVFGFGLIHGLGFAGALNELDLPRSAFTVGLVGFNFGVEGGQLAVISLAMACTFWVRDPEHYRRRVVIPCSSLIAALGAFWTIQRIFMTP
jgi:hydrogenase/urease accessory protein HupE